MADNQISTHTAGEPGFTVGSFFLRLLLALTVVLLSFNPSGFSFFHWTRDAFFDSSLGPLHLLASLFAVAVVLTVGMSWAHLRRRLSGQATVDEVDSYLGWP